MDATASAGGLELLPFAVSLPCSIGVYRVRGLASLGLLVPASLVSSCLSGVCFLWSGCFVQLRPAPARSMRATMQANSVCVRWCFVRSCKPILGSADYQTIFSIGRLPH